MELASMDAPTDLEVVEDERGRVGCMKVINTMFLIETAVSRQHTERCTEAPDGLVGLSVVNHNVGRADRTR